MAATTTPDPVQVFIGLGSNVDPERHLRFALRALGEAGLPPARCSSVYRSAAVGFAGDDFLNMVVECRTERSPADVEARLAAVEDAAGRDRSGPKFGPRTLDLDLLSYGRRVDAEHGLPRADLLCYLFVLGPLAELAPDWTHPLTGETAAGRFARLAARGPALSRLGPLE